VRTGTVFAALLLAVVAAIALAQNPSPATSSSPDGKILFRANYAEFPDAGFGSAEGKYLGTHFTRELLPKGGPQGQAAVRLTALPNQTGQFNWGNRGNIVPADAVDGESRFYRFRMRLNGNNRGVDWNSGAGPATMQNKLLIIGQGCGRECRVILTYQADQGGIRNFRVQMDGGGDPADTGSYKNGMWLDVQLEVVTSDRKKGIYRLWVNSNKQTSPTAESRNIPLEGRNHKYVWLGGFMNDGLMAGGSHTLDLADFEIGTAFDPAWHK
jgi:hypothetical protein